MADLKRELLATQLKLDFYKEHLDAQDNRISDISTNVSLVGLPVAMLGMLITGIIIFFSLRVREEKLILRRNKRPIANQRMGKKRRAKGDFLYSITQEFQPRLSEALTEIRR